MIALVLDQIIKFLDNRMEKLTATKLSGMI